MPSIVGSFKINTVGPSSIIHIGDSLVLSPTSSSKSYAGSGSFNTGDFPVTNNALSSTNTFDPDGVDDSVKKVASI
ncbi:spore germination protein [Gorillibacterium timonense]|uniref:spore germination protein n=1 Tax=Gorillibacterium timonense TaxID=1689269 RepID=UPI00071C990C|nr:spore germination protein [Gorillibacterium timonense]